MKKYHAPGLGEVHSSDHLTAIFCERNIDSEYTEGEYNRSVDDELAKKICDLLNGWNKTSDELPPEGEEVLVYVPNSKIRKFELAYTNSCYEHLWCIDGDELYFDVLPTHWMRIPTIEN